MMTELEEVLEDTTAFISRFVWFRHSWYANVLALWVAHTWAFDAAQQTPYIWIVSPEMGSGKTRLLEVLGLVVRRPWHVIEPSESVTFRKIDLETPTMLLDEIDVVFSRDRKSDSQAGLRAIINSGNRFGATVARADNFGNDLREFKVFCPKAFAGIGKMIPATVVDRSIKIPMDRKLPSERVERFKLIDVKGNANELRARLVKIVTNVKPELEQWREWRPESELLENDRAAESWEPLFAIGETAGGRWTDGTRKLADKVQEARAKDVPPGVLLLLHIREAFDRAGTDRLSSHDLLTSLVSRDDGPWAHWWKMVGQAEMTELSRKLQEFGIESKTIRIGEQTPKGYLRRDFEDAWARYLPKPDAVGAVETAERMAAATAAY
jgi:hypothetical protein